MSDGAGFINDIIEKSNSFICTHGGASGYQLFREDYAKSISINTDINQFSLEYIQSIDRGEAESPLYSRTLISLYVASEQNAKAPDFLKDWIFERLIKISDGESADNAFHLNLGRGIRRTKQQHNRLMCVCYVELKLRDGMKKTEAVESCRKSFGATENTIFRFLRGVKIGNHISDKTLVFYKDNDVSDDYCSY